MNYLKASALSMAISAGLMLSTQALAADTIKIAAVGPVTGPVTQYGDMVREGIRTAIESINAAGGYDGKQFEMVEVDDACEPKQGPIAANNVVNKEIGFVVGPVCSGATVGGASIYNQEGVVMITPSATAPNVTDGKNFDFVFRTIGRDDQQGPAAAKYIIDSVKPSKVAILHDKQSYGQGIASSVQDNLKKADVAVALFEGINAGETDYSSVITKMKSAGVDFVYYGGYHPEMGLLMRQAAEQGLKVKFMGPEGAGNPEINAIAGEAVEGMLLTLPADYSALPENKAVVEAFKAKKRNASGAFQLTSYAATQAIFEGIKATKSTDPEKVAEWLHGNTVKSVIGDLSWNKQGDLNEFKFDIYTWHKDGSKTAVK
ncbi:L-leucine-binding protein /L-isoleucine-binding protein /L-valine-binding protein [Advenella incenata]|jgi:branched-chain amino acid transport system substrate-binding protein|uniref:L-leucine-binding protein /L-isoleucine-binding protein /L-valine-binding protein n=1 Tax=Advenella incenata TaxID=267800 RepID=A0A4Q7VV96_9BURK|nr:high-affinity branched-chain amino acid ABC transporter substrate-binding protein [Advenella incenata]RZU00229.1 L-leucine-binding protein /L-isoleucine-binding protein /L-valine-binding protein [Advenella incenata]